MDKEPKIEFEPFIKFVIEFHNSSLYYNQLLNNKVRKKELNFTLEDIRHIEEAFFIKHVAEWEAFVQNMVTYCVAIDTKQLCSHLEITLPTKISFDNAYAILNGINFLSITDSSSLIGFSKKTITKENNPFLRFGRPILKYIDEAYIIRNYLSHKSKKSKKTLHKLYRDQYNIEDFIEPGKFLAEELVEEMGSYPRSNSFYGSFMTMTTLIWRTLDKKSYDFVFEDENTKEGWLQGIVKMNLVFEHLTKSLR